MPATLFRLYLDNNAASRDDLDSVEEITVEQEMDMSSEAQLVVPVRTSDKGTWSAESSPVLTRARRVRVEIKVGSGAWTPLIDGPVVRIDMLMSPEPGQSKATLVVHDDSVWLAREDEQKRFDDMLDHEVARQLFQSVSQITSTDIEQTTGAGSAATTVAVQRGTAIEMLMRLAKRNGMHAYVRPGDSPGTSVGVFRKLATRGDGIPDLVLLGADRNLARWDSANDNERPVTAVAYSLDVFSKKTASAEAGLGDVTLLGSDPPLVSGAKAGRRVLSPGHGAFDAKQRVAAEAERASFAVTAGGEVMSDCYGGVLTPYRVVTVRGVDGRQSGDYAIRQVTHSLGRSLYTQTFQLMRNARSAGANAQSTAIPAGIF
ncbi:MAG: hypothetical protein ABJC63_01125 [Gemmatimonadales bacterium]